MNINFNSVCHTISSHFKEGVLASLSHRQKQILVIGSLALGLFSLCYIALARRYCFKGSVKEGQGKDSFLFGWIVREGEFKNYKLNGQGKITKFFGETEMTGEFRDDRLHGQGKIINKKTGFSYEGGFKEGNPFGQGKATAYPCRDSSIKDYIVEGTFDGLWNVKDVSLIKSGQTVIKAAELSFAGLKGSSQLFTYNSIGQLIRVDSVRDASLPPAQQIITSWHDDGKVTQERMQSFI